MAYFLFVILLLLIAVRFVRVFRSRDRRMLWAPSVFLCIYLTYYIIIPFLKGGGEASDRGQVMLLGGALLFYLVFQAVFLAVPKKYSLNRLNSLIDDRNSLWLSIVLFLLAFAGNAIINGSNLSVLSSRSLDDFFFDSSSAYGHADKYISYLISLFPTSCALIYACRKKISPLLVLMVTVSTAIYLIGGFRFRILVFIVVLVLFYYLYPSPRKVNYFVVVPLAIALYLSMGVIEKTRIYGLGLDSGALEELIESGDIGESEENMLVYQFSAECMDQYKVGDFLLFEPLVNAVCSPLPRSLFPWKPQGTYLREANIRIYGTITRGCAYLNIVEGYLSFGWLGIILYAMLLGWLSRVVWTNYLSNSTSVTAVLLLGLFNGILYQIISRGYMAQALTTFIYYMVIPFLLVALFNFFTILARR